VSDATAEDVTDEFAPADVRATVSWLKITAGLGMQDRSARFRSAPLYSPSSGTFLTRHNGVWQASSATKVCPE